MSVFMTDNVAKSTIRNRIVWIQRKHFRRIKNHLAAVREKIPGKCSARSIDVDTADANIPSNPKSSISPKITAIVRLVNISQPGNFSPTFETLLERIEPSSSFKRGRRATCGPSCVKKANEVTGRYSNKCKILPVTRNRPSESYRSSQWARISIGGCIGPTASANDRIGLSMTNTRE